MTDALGGAAIAKPTLTEQANAQRIGRARFIGNTVGITLILAAIAGGVIFAASKATASVPDQPAVPWTAVHYAATAAITLLVLALLDLGVRRRHDRGRSGVDCVVALILLEGIAIMAIFGHIPAEVPIVAVAAAGGAIALYLVVTMAILPSAKGNNAYGPPPYVEHR